MRLDARGFILTMWVTFLTGTVSSTVVINYFIRTHGDAGLPHTLSQAWFIIVGLWLGGILGGLLTGLLGWSENVSQTLWTSLMGYWVAAALRLLLLGRFLPGGDGVFNVIWQALTFQGFPAYDAFWLLVLVGGTVLVVMAGVFSATYQRYLAPDLPDLTVPAPLLATLIGLSPVLMLFLIALGNLGSTDYYPEFRLEHVDWLVLPQVNMILAAVLGFLVGGTYLCKNRYAAATTMLIAMMAHVILMLLLEGILGTYDPLYTPLNPNRVNLAAFLFMWLGVPLVGEIAAFALHNLRDAFRLTPDYDDLEESAS